MIANFELLAPHLTAATQETIIARAALHERYSSIDFKILEVKPPRLVLRITQGKSHAGNYFDNKRLSEIGKELFDGLLDWDFITRPIPYQERPTDVVTPEWIDNQIKAKGIKLKDLSVALSIDANTLSAYRNGLKTLTGPVKAAFYYYFQTK